MLARYRMVRGKRRTDDPLPTGTRIDTRKHTRHFLRPDKAEVAALLADVDGRWPSFKQAYLALLERRAIDTPEAFDDLATRAKAGDVFLGCNCPTRRQPLVARCHTVLALRFMKQRYPELEVVLP